MLPASENHRFLVGFAGGVHVDRLQSRLHSATGQPAPGNHGIAVTTIPMEAPAFPNGTARHRQKKADCFVSPSDHCLCESEVTAVDWQW